VPKNGNGTNDVYNTAIQIYNTGVPKLQKQAEYMQHVISFESISEKLVNQMKRMNKKS
jgi:hypothetical protein